MRRDPSSSPASRCRPPRSAAKDRALSAGLNGNGACDFFFVTFACVRGVPECFFCLLLGPGFLPFYCVAVVCVANMVDINPESVVRVSSSLIRRVRRLPETHMM